MTSSIYPLPFTLDGAPIAADTDILTSDIVITEEQLSPGGGGTLRVLFSFVFGVSPSRINVFNNGSLKGAFNADNSFNIVDDGLYRFDVEVEPGDNINFQSTEVISTALSFRLHLVLIGA